MSGTLLNRGKSSSARTRRAVIKRSRQQEKRTERASSEVPACEATRRLQKSAQKRKRQKWQSQEKKAAKRMGGKLTPGSGNQWAAKSDVRTKKLLVECKRTDKSTYSLRLDTLRKVELEALRLGLVPVLLVELDGHEYAVLRGTDYEEWS